jgi:hypothetical protein
MPQLSMHANKDERWITDWEPFHQTLMLTENTHHIIILLKYMTNTHIEKV